MKHWPRGATALVKSSAISWGRGRPARMRGFAAFRAEKALPFRLAS